MGFVYFYLAFTAFQNLRMACKHLMLKWDEPERKTHEKDPQIPTLTLYSTHPWNKTWFVNFIYTDFLQETFPYWQSWEVCSR